MKLDLIYINESKRIRRTYLTNLIKIVENEDCIKDYLEIIQQIKDNIVDSEIENEKFYKDKLFDINKNINEIRKKIEPYYDEIKKLDNDQSKLYNNIKDKYPNISDEDIQNQIVPYIIEIDKEFIKKNEEIYNKMMKK